MKIILIGIQGSGKSTQGNLLSHQLKIPYLSTGHIFRRLAKKKTRLGKHIKILLSSGMLVPDDLAIEIVNDYLSRPEYRNGYILDGFPRTLRQAKEFLNDIDRAIYIELSDKEALWRLAYRQENRNDNSIQAILKRIQSFHQQTQEVINLYKQQGKLTRVSGNLSIDKVNQEILKSLGKQMIHRHLTNWKHKQKSIIAVVGLAGAGKTEVVNYLKKKDLPIVSFSRVINDYIDKRKLSHTEEVHRRLRLQFRKKYGKAAMAVLNKNELVKALESNMIVVIEGLYSWEEYIYLKEHFPGVKIYILAIYADKALRYQRIARRSYRSQVGGEKRDINELMETNKGPTIAFADYLIKNNYSREDLYDEVEEVYRSIYFS